MRFRRSNFRAFSAGVMALALSFAAALVNAEELPAELPRQTLELAVASLLSQQQPDGAWRSGTYAQLKTGQALTPFVFDALLRAEASGVKIPEKARYAARMFIVKHVDARLGFLGLDDLSLPEYPTYATAYGLMCLARLNDARDAEVIMRMAAALADSQFNEKNGIPKEHPAYGGWGFSPIRPKASTGHMDLAHTRRVLEALRAAKNHGVTVDEAVFNRAQVFLTMVQRHPDDPRVGAVEYDGGFYLSPVVTPVNKGGQAPAANKFAAYYRSYATATCDGLLALLATGMPRDDERVKKAINWLYNHADLEYPAGVPEDHPDGMGYAIHYYHFAVRAEALARVTAHGDAAWRGQVVALLSRRQEKSGGFVNLRNALMKENDPLVCTALAVIALSEACAKAKD